MRVLNVGSIVGVVALASIAVSAPQASAVDWKQAFPAGTAVPASLGAFEPAPSVEVQRVSKDGWYPCAAFRIPAAQRVVSAMYLPVKPERERTFDARAYVYPSSTKAEQAYAQLRKKLKTCNGKQDLAFGESGPNTMRRTTTTGTLTDLSITGVPSVFVYGKTVPLPGAGKPAMNSGGNYVVYTLVGDAILSTSAGQVGSPGYTADQRAGIVGFASDFEETWVLANDG